MSFEPGNGESSVAGAFRERLGRHSGQGQRQTAINSFTSIQTNNSQSFQLGPLATEGPRRTIGGHVIDLTEHDVSVQQSFETTVSNQGQLAGGRDSLAASDLEESLTLDETRIFESSKTHFFYQEAQHEQWVTWWEKTPGFRAYRDKHTGKKQIRWNSTARGTEMWKYYRQCAVKCGKDIGRPNIQCVLCGTVLAHPAATGTTSMHDHHKSQSCKKIRQRNVTDDGSTLTLEELWQKGTKVSKVQIFELKQLLMIGNQIGNRKLITDATLPDGYDQAQFDHFFLEALLATNMSFNSVNNAAFRRVFKYLKRDSMLPSPTTTRNRLQSLYGEIVEKIRNEIPSGVKISIAVDTWTSPNNIAFLALAGYWITDDWDLREVLLGFEQIHGAHTGENLAELVGDVLKRYGIESQLLGFTSDSASNNGTLAAALSNALDQLSVDWNCDHNHIPCMAHVVQLILGAFMDHLKIKSKGESMPSNFKESYVGKVASMEAGFFKTVEKVSSSPSYLV